MAMAGEESNRGAANPKGLPPQNTPKIDLSDAEFEALFAESLFANNTPQPSLQMRPPVPNQVKAVPKQTPNPTDNRASTPRPAPNPQRPLPKPLTPTPNSNQSQSRPVQSSFVPDAFDDFDNLFSQQHGVAPLQTPPTPNINHPAPPLELFARSQPLPVKPLQAHVHPNSQTRTNPNKEQEEARPARFQPTTVAVQRRRKKNEEYYEPSRWDIVGTILQGALFIAVALFTGYFALLQLGAFQPNTTPINTNTTGSLAMLWSNGSIINVDAGQTYLNLPPPVAATATAIPTPTAQPTNNTTVVQQLTATPLPTFTPLFAPTATPLPVTSRPQPVLAQSPTPNPIGVAVDYSQSPPTRLVIPKIGLDTVVKEVTVKLGSWQVADYAAGHNLGTAYPGEIGNMVLAGHRDIRGNVFLRLPELQTGDQFQVYSNAGVFRYQVTSVFEVDPTDISVMNPSPESIATLITCTPLGTSARRLIVRAKLVN
jgi:sortase A